MRNSPFWRLAAATLAAALCFAADPFFLRRQLADLRPDRGDDLVTGNGVKSAVYRPIFGIGDAEAGRLQGIARYGELTVGPGGSSAMVSCPAEEQIYYVLEGVATLVYGDQRVPVRKEDFAYLPVDVAHGIVNNGSALARVMVMGFRIPPGVKATPTPKLLLANSADVPLQVLPSHGPTTQFRLLMGQTSSQRDRLAAASEMTSLFIMDFAAGGTNNPHSHGNEEEIYLLLRGHGEIVAGRNADGQDVRYPVDAGALFYFGPGTRVGYYSAAKEGQEHDLILAVRSRLPGASR